MFGAGNQNKNLSDAASKRKDTSPRTVTSNKYAAKIASGARKPNSSSVDNGQGPQYASKDSIKTQRPDPVKGSFEGLQSGSSTMIQMEGSGYLDKNFQTARYTRKQIANYAQSISLGNNFTQIKNSGIINNLSSIAFKNTSAHKLQNIMGINKFL